MIWWLRLIYVVAERLDTIIALAKLVVGLLAAFAR